MTDNFLDVEWKEPTDAEKLREGIAEHAHIVWQRWMAYMLTNLDDEHIERWKRQANTAYKDLPEHEKASDRSIAGEYLQACKEAGLKFVPDEIILPFYKACGFDSVYWEATKKVIDEAINSQIKEIEVS